MNNIYKNRVELTLRAAAKAGRSNTLTARELKGVTPATAPTPKPAVRRLK